MNLLYLLYMEVRYLKSFYFATQCVWLILIKTIFNKLLFWLEFVRDLSDLGLKLKPIN